MNKEFNKLQATISKNISNISKAFDDYQQGHFQERPAEFFCLELNGESGELANFEKKKWKGLNVAHEALAEEAADVFIALINYANSRGINMEAALMQKLQLIEDKRVELKGKGEKY